nr:OmpA family protein [uncultured Carboxylicivirga sp.]
MRKVALLYFYMMIAFAGFTQENPKISKELFLSATTENTKAVEKLFNTAEKYYQKGHDYYGEALKYYVRLYQLAPESSELNYKIGVCCLYSSNPKRALQYFEKCTPDVASDYHLHLGRAYQYNLQYINAQRSYEVYSASLSPAKQKSFSKELEQLTRECIFGNQAVQDTLPVFIKNLGPIINTYYDEYAAVFSSQGDSAIFFTSRRPKREPKNIKPRTKYNERILVSKNCLYSPADEVGEPKVFGSSEGATLRSGQNLSVSGIIDEKNRLLYYKGKKNNGDIYTASIIEDRVLDFKKIRGKVDHIAYQETSMTAELDNGYFIDTESEGKGKKGIWQTAYFVSDRPGGEGGKDIWQCTWKKKLKFKNVQNIGADINTPFDEEAVYVTPDGKTLYFASNGHQGMGGFDIFKCEKQSDGKWSKPVNMGYPINTPANELFYHPTPDSMFSLLATTRDGGYGGLDIYKVEKDPRIPFQLSGQVTENKDSSVLNATISIFNIKDESLLLSTNQDTVTGKYLLDFEDVGLYMAHVEAPGYRSVKDTIECPTKRHEKVEANYQLEKLKYPFTLYGNVYNIKTGDPVQAKIELRSEIDTTILYSTVSNSETGAYSLTVEDKMTFNLIVSSEDYYSKEEILELKKVSGDKQQKYIQLKPNKILYYLTGNIYEEESNEPINGRVSFTRPGEEKPFAFSELDSISKKYTLKVEEAGPFILQVDAEGYFFMNDTHEFKSDSTLIIRDFTLKKMKSGAKIVVENILFNTGKSTLKPSSFVELDKLANLLIENKDVRIEVSGHTDNVGSASVNKKISKARALTVRNYLLSKGVETERVTYMGYGFDQPIADNTTPEGRAQNRRVEIKVIE